MALRTGLKSSSHPAISATEEQAAIRDLVVAGESVVVQALAGSGKSSTLRLCAEAVTDRRIQYVAFNRKVVEDAIESFGGSANCNTMHSLAFRAVGKRYAHRLQDNKRIASKDLAEMLGLRQWFRCQTDGERKDLSSWKLASLTKQAVIQFCFSDDPEPALRHVPYVDGIDVPEGGKRGWSNNNRLRQELMPYVHKMWRDWQDPNGIMPYAHDSYLKSWSLDDPKIDADIVMLDESQDTSPVMIAILQAQTNAQLVTCGDSYQAIYSWRGARDALSGFDIDNVRYLTQSFRFGQPIADVANCILAWLGCPVEMRGNPAVSSSVGRVSMDEANAVLCRTNAEAVQLLLDYGDQTTSVHLVGDIATRVRNFAQAALDLQNNGKTSFAELACFKSWDEVRAYVVDDPLGIELQLMVRLLDRSGPQRILAAVLNMVSESRADLVVSTAHISKGRQWPAVRLAADFPGDDEEDVFNLSAEERRLLYVAITRAQNRLDHSQAKAVAHMAGLDPDGEKDM